MAAAWRGPGRPRLRRSPGRSAPARLVRPPGNHIGQAGEEEPERIAQPEEIGGREVDELERGFLDFSLVLAPPSDTNASMASSTATMSPQALRKASKSTSWRCRYRSMLSRRASGTSSGAVAGASRPRSARIALRARLARQRIADPGEELHDEPGAALHQVAVAHDATSIVGIGWSGTSRATAWLVNTAAVPAPAGRENRSCFAVIPASARAKVMMPKLLANSTRRVCVALARCSAWRRGRLAVALDRCRGVGRRILRIERSRLGAARQRAARTGVTRQRERPRPVRIAGERGALGPADARQQQRTAHQRVANARERAGVRRQPQWRRVVLEPPQTHHGIEELEHILGEREAAVQHDDAVGPDILQRAGRELREAGGPLVPAPPVARLAAVGVVDVARQHDHPPVRRQPRQYFLDAVPARWTTLRRRPDWCRAGRRSPCSA